MHLPLNVRLVHINSRTFSKTHIYCSWKMTWTRECMMNAPLIVLQSVCKLVYFCLYRYLHGSHEQWHEPSTPNVTQMSILVLVWYHQLLSVVLALDIVEIFMQAWYWYWVQGWFWVYSIYNIYLTLKWMTPDTLPHSWKPEQLF